MAQEDKRFEQYLDKIPDWKKEQQGKHKEKMVEQGEEPPKPPTPPNEPSESGRKNAR